MALARRDIDAKLCNSLVILLAVVAACSGSPDRGPAAGSDTAGGGVGGRVAQPGNVGGVAVPGDDGGRGGRAGSGEDPGGTGGIGDAGAGGSDPGHRELVHETFDSAATAASPEGWELQTDGGKIEVREVPFAETKSLYVGKPGTGADLGATIRFPATSGLVLVETKLKAAQTAGFKVAPYILSPTGAPLVSVALDGGRIRASQGSQMTNVQPFLADTWYVIRAVVDTKAQTYDLYVDGVKQRSRAPLRSPGTSVGQVTFRIGEGQSGGFFVDWLRVYEVRTYIGAPPEPVFDVRSYGAVGDGKTKDTKALQAAIDAVPESGGSVLLREGTFVSGTIALKSRVTLFVDASATLLGSEDPADFPAPRPAGVVGISTFRTLIYMNAADRVTLDGGGTIDGNGSLPVYRVNSNGTENDRPTLLWPVHSTNLRVQNLYFKDSAVWGLVPTECDGVTFDNIYIHTPYWGNRDGIDVVDSWNVTIRDSTIFSDDDAICPKSFSATGVGNLDVKNVNITTVVRANGIKFGTNAYGELTNATFEDVLLKNVGASALALQSTDGADISKVTFRRIEIDGSGTPFFMIIQDRNSKPGNAPHKIGSIDGVLYRDVRARRTHWQHGSALLGFRKNDVTYAPRNIAFENVSAVFKGGASAMPAAPPEPDNGYPEANMNGDFPAWGLYFRHIDRLTFSNTQVTVEQADVRPKVVFDDVSNLSGSP